MKSRRSASCEQIPSEIENDSAKIIDNPAVLKTAIFKKSALVNGKKVPYKRESIQFSVQPNSNSLVTPDHPLFLNKMQKLEQYKHLIKQS